MRVFKGRGSYIRGRRLLPGKKGDQRPLPGDIDAQQLPAEGLMRRVIKPYSDGKGKNWEAYAMEEMAALLPIPGYKYVPVPKAWDGVLVPADDTGQLDPRKTVADIVYADIKKTSNDGPPELGENQVFGARHFPTKVLQFVWPHDEATPQAAYIKSGPVRSKGSARLMSSARKAEYIQNRAAHKSTSGVPSAKKRKR